MASVTVHCTNPECPARFTVDESLLGKKARCKKCQKAFVLTRRGRPALTEDDFRELLVTLDCHGFGWLRPEGVRRELEKMAAAWPSPPPLPGT